MRYLSTRSGQAAQPAAFRDILLEGLAPDGGLYWPVQFPQLDRADRAELRRLYELEGYPRLAWAVLSRYIDDIPSDDLLRLCQRAYTADKFGSSEIVPVTQWNGLWLAHLSNGPTAAFKDLAMQLLAELFDYELTRRDQWLTILGATSGDTGSAAEYAMRGKARIQVFMLSPQGRMTPFQRGQMYGLHDPGIVNITVPGAFDDCQDLVKQVNADAAFKTRYHLGAVNSINWARLVAQVVYYVAAWLQVTSHDDEAVSFAVPTGNFGNIISGHIARQMGLPIRQLILATNENNVLAEFFATGLYRVRSSVETVATSSPSMDISKASNFERFVFDLLDRDSATVARLFGPELATSGQFQLPSALVDKARDDYGLVAGSANHHDRVETIRRVAQEHQYVIDPHTADGVTVAAGRQSGVGVGSADRVTIDRSGPIICLETALPIKFADTVIEAIGQPAPVPDRFAAVLAATPQTVDLVPGDGADRVKAVIAATSTEH